MRSTTSTAILSITIITAVSSGADPPAQPPLPAEELRLNTGAFRAGLKKRGLTELLELHLRDFPPANETEALVMMREVKLAEFCDPGRSQEERRAAVARANDILERLIADTDRDPRRFDWRFTLAHSLIYDEAEPYLTSILYRGGSAGDRERLLALSTRAVASLTTLLTDLSREFDRIDRMSIREFETVSGKGYFEKLDRLAPQAEYLLLWACFYDALPRGDADPLRARRLNEIIEKIAGNPVVIETPHATSRVQVQALLLAGMTHRRLYNHQPAREHLDRALGVAEGLNDPTERTRVDWAVTLARLERLRNDVDDGRFNEALRGLAEFRSAIGIENNENFGMRLVAAFTERWIYKRRAAAAARDGKQADARRYRDRAWRSLACLAMGEPERRDELYAASYDMIDPDTDTARLDPLEQCALIAGLLAEAQESIEEADALLDRAIGVGARFLSEADSTASSLVPEVIYNMGVAEYRRGRQPAAAERFLEVARDYPTFSGAPQAAALAVQVAAELYGDSALGTHPQVQQLYRDTLDTLIARYSDTDTARYWRFYRARLLDELGEYDKAAAEYYRVAPAHEHSLDSLFYRLRCLALSLQRDTVNGSADRSSLQRRTDDILAARHEFVSRAAGRLQDEDASTLRGLLVRARLFAAEVQVLDQVDRPARALELLAGFEEDHPGEPALAGRVWRVRLLAYERLERLDEASRAIPAYVAADPKGSGVVLQSLHRTLVADIESLQSPGAKGPSQRKAKLALILARQIHDQAAGQEASPTLQHHRLLTIQLAEANLRAGHLERARELFEPLLPATSVPTSRLDPTDVPVLLGHAEALFGLGEFALALPQFNQLATALPPEDPIRWRALLRDLLCRSKLGHPPQGIIKVIQQQRQLYPELGGPDIAPQLERLLREARRYTD